MTGIFHNQTASRPTPKLPTNLYKTYRIMQPITTHYRLASCAEIDCPAYTKGWIYKKSELIANDLYYTVTHAGKRYREEEYEDGAIYLAFEPGQSCFQAPTHRKTLERPAFYYAGRGDFRSFSTRRALQFPQPEDWRDSFAEHLDALHTAIERG